MSKVRTLFAFWLVPYGASTWRRFAYALVVVPTAIGSLSLALVGRGGAAARYQRHLASKLVGTPADEPPRRPTDPAVLAISVGMTAVGVACWLLLWRFTSAVLVVPLVASCLALVVAGRAPARLGRRPARGSLGLPVGAPTLRWMGMRVGVHAVAGVVVGLVCWTLLSYLAWRSREGVSQEPGGVALLNGGEHLQHHPSIGIRVQLGLPTFMHEWCAMTRFTR